LDFRVWVGSTQRVPSWFDVKPGSSTYAVWGLQFQGKERVCCPRLGSSQRCWRHSAALLISSGGELLRKGASLFGCPRLGSSQRCWRHSAALLISQWASGGELLRKGASLLSSSRVVSAMLASFGCTVDLPMGFGGRSASCGLPRLGCREECSSSSSSSSLSRSSSPNAMGAM